MHQVGWIVLVICGLAVLAMALGRRERKGLPIRAKPLMTDRETQFWRLLRDAAEPLHVAPQVALAALITTERGLDRSDGQQARNRFSQKIVDFVLVDDDGAARLIVELDDRTHLAAKDAARDAMTRRAGYQTLRVNGVAARDIHLLKAALDEALGRPPRWTPPAFNPAVSPHRARNRSARPNIRRA